MIGYSLSFYAKMYLMTFDLVQRHRKVKSGPPPPHTHTRLKLVGMDQRSVIDIASFI